MVHVLWGSSSMQPIGSGVLWFFRHGVEILRWVGAVGDCNWPAPLQWLYVKSNTGGIDRSIITAAKRSLSKSIVLIQLDSYWLTIRIYNQFTSAERLLIIASWSLVFNSHFDFLFSWVPVQGEDLSWDELFLGMSFSQTAKTPACKFRGAFVWVVKCAPQMTGQAHSLILRAEVLPSTGKNILGTGVEPGN